MLKTEILNNWKTDIIGNAQILESLVDKNYPAWSVRFDDDYGVAIPYKGDDAINESFASAKIRSSLIEFQTGETQNAIVLTTTSKGIMEQFAVLCEALVDPGNNGESRNQIETNPLSWWKDWKELLGNKNIDARIYDVLGELCVLKYAINSDADAEWNGPMGASYDIETEEQFIEVKSTINRSKKEAVISNQFQLDPPGKKLYIALCQFEPSIKTGVCIDEIVNDFENKGYNPEMLNTKLELQGFEKGMSARRKKFILHDILLYRVDSSFPRITTASFVGGVMPAGITKVSYTVDFSGMPAISVKQGESNAI